MDVSSLFLFVAAGLLLNLTPGPDVLFIVSHALRAGARAGIVAACGITLGVFVHIAAAALGLGALLATSSTAFTALKWIGGAYLVWIGLRALRTPGAATILPLHEGGLSSMHAGVPADSQAAAAAPAAAPADAPTVPWPAAPRGPALRAVFWSGFATNALNPKVALFFLAFLPQFIGPEIADKALAFAALGLLFNFNSLWVNIGWALAAAWLARRASAMRRHLALIDRIAGVLFIGFGLRLVFSDNAAH